MKPFALEELMARVRAVLRRRGTIPQVLEVERLLVDEEHGFAARGGRELALTSTELRLLAFLMRHRGQALSKDQLLTQVWGSAFAQTSHLGQARSERQARLQRSSR